MAWFKKVKPSLTFSKDENTAIYIDEEGIKTEFEAKYHGSGDCHICDFYKSDLCSMNGNNKCSECCRKDKRDIYWKQKPEAIKPDSKLDSPVPNNKKLELHIIFNDNIEHNINFHTSFNLNILELKNYIINNDELNSYVAFGKIITMFSLIFILDPEYQNEAKKFDRDLKLLSKFVDKWYKKYLELYFS